MRQKIRCLVIIAIATIILVGCIAIPVPLPPRGNLYTTKNKIEDLVDDGVSKSVVIEQLGNPLKYRSTSMSYKACYEPFGVGVLLVAAGGMGADFQQFRGETNCFELTLNFDQDGLLTGYQKNPWQGDIDFLQEDLMLVTLANQNDAVAKRLWLQSIGYRSSDDYENDLSEAEAYIGEAIKLAEDGDPNTMYHIYLAMYDAYIHPVAAWDWLCKAADLGHENARIEVAYWHRKSNWALTNSGRIAWLRKAHVRPDDCIAYLWYTLAANGNEKRLGIRDDLFTETLSSGEIIEAQGMVKNWKSGQCEKELSLAIENEK